MNSLIKSYRDNIAVQRQSQIEDAWQFYEDNNFDWCCMACMQAVKVKDYPDEYRDYTNEEIFSEIEYNLAYYRAEIETTWQEEYELFCESQHLDEESFLEWYSLAEEIKSKNKVWKKKRKHIKDNPKKYWWYLYDKEGIGVHVGAGRTYCNWELSWKYHKHKRAEKVFTQEESEQYFSYYKDCDRNCWFDDWLEVAIEDLEEHNWLCREIGLPHYASDFDWVNELGTKDTYWCHPNGYCYHEDGLPFCKNTVLPSWYKETRIMVEFFDQFK